MNKARTGLTWLLVTWYLQTTDTNTTATIQVGGTVVQTFTPIPGPAANGLSSLCSQVAFDKTLIDPMIVSAGIRVEIKPYVNNVTIAAGKIRCTIIET